MGILSAMSGSMQQTLMHVLQECESEGLTSIVEVRTKISNELNKQFPHSRRLIGRHKYHQENQSKQSIIYCPKCQDHNQIMTPIKVDDDGVVDLVMQCKKCRYSYLV